MPLVRPRRDAQSVNLTRKSLFRHSWPKITSLFAHISQEMSENRAQAGVTDDELLSASARDFLLEEVALSADRKGVVILEPGSYNLRFGFAEAQDRRPASTVNCVAYRRDHPLLNWSSPYPTTIPFQDGPSKRQHSSDVVETSVATMIPTSSPSNADFSSTAEWELSLAQLEFDYNPLVSELSRVTKNSSVRFITTDNCAESVEESADSQNEWANLSGLPNSILCDQALYLDDKDGYDIYFPIRLGRFNFQCSHMTDYGENRFPITLMHVLDSLERIWRHVTFDRLEIAPQQAALYDVLLIIPDSFIPSEIAHMVDILLNSVGFGHVLLQKSSICAALGAGRNDTCVVNIGFSGTTICCVNDLQLLPGSCFSSLVGGMDVSRLLKAQLAKYADSQFFRYTDANMDASIQDLIIFEEMKESCCHLNPSLVQPKMYEFLVRNRHASLSRLFRVSIGMAQFFAPMVLCVPTLDRFRHIKHHNAQIRSAESVEHSALPHHWADLFAPSSHLISNKPKTLASPSDPQETSSKKSVADLSLAHLIVASINAVASLDHQTRLFSQILIVGGSAHLNNLPQLIETEVQQLLSSSPTPSVIVSLPPAGVDVSDCAWTGASYMATQTPRECWLDRVAWRTFGVLALREKLLFSWDNPQNLE